MTDTLIPDLGVMTRIDGLLASVGAVAGLRVIDIGCGEGQVARAFAERGATVAGYDPFIPPTDWIKAGDGEFRLANATADAIPEPDASADLVLFVFSLHHVPRHQLAGAMTEARRLLKPDGRLCIAEPVAEGPSQYVMEIYHDETEVRRVAAEAMAEFAAPLFGNEKIIRYRERRTYSEFDAFAEHAIAGTRFNDYKVEDVLSPQVRRRFDEMFAICGGNFDQPIRLNIFA
jgi:ubiquinone/menaquinone biosynthesis C-methylase UbiE